MTPNPTLNRVGKHSDAPVGLTTKIHLAAGTRCRPLSRNRKGRGRPRTRPGRVLGDNAYSNRAIRSPCGDA